MSDRMFSQDLAKHIKDFMDMENMSYLYHDGVFYLSIWIEGPIRVVQYFVTIHMGDVSVLAASPIAADPNDTDQVIRVLEFVNRANFNLRIGKFEFNMDEGEIRYSYYMNCEDITPSVSMIAEAIRYPAAIFERYGEGLVRALYKKEPVAQIIDECENKDNPRETPSVRTDDDDGDDDDVDDVDDLDGLRALLDELKNATGLDVSDEDFWIKDDDDAEDDGQDETVDEDDADDDQQGESADEDDAGDGDAPDEEVKDGNEKDD